MAKKFAVLGKPIEHSKSPIIHIAAYEKLGLDWTYERFELAEANLRGFIEQTDFEGFSLTMPLKDKAFELYGSNDQSALRAHAVNTMYRVAGVWETYNTDVFGLMSALRGISFEEVAILGSGATARNALIAIRELNREARATILARNAEKAFELVSFANELGLTAEVPSTTSVASAFDLTISTLPPSADALSFLAGEPSGTLLDVAYSPWPSSLASHWLASGGNVISGIEMLIWQAIAQIRIFVNGSVAEPLENEQELAMVMRNASLAEG